MLPTYSRVRRVFGLVFFGAQQAPSTHTFRQRIEQRHRLFPADAAVGDALRIHQLFAGHEILPPRIDMALAHHAENALVAGTDLTGHVTPNFDLSLVKNTRIREDISLQFRAESFNLSNTPHLWMPYTAFGNLQFGRINSTTGFPRVNQLSLKLYF